MSGKIFEIETGVEVTEALKKILADEALLSQPREELLMEIITLRAQLTDLTEALSREKASCDHYQLATREYGYRLNRLQGELRMRGGKVGVSQVLDALYRVRDHCCHHGEDSMLNANEDCSCTRCRAHFERQEKGQKQSCSDGSQQ